jgi:hypothetical protein
VPPRPALFLRGTPGCHGHCRPDVAAKPAQRLNGQRSAAQRTK